MSSSTKLWSESVRWIGNSEPRKDKVVKASSGNRRGYDDLEKQADQAVEDETDYSYEEDQARGPRTAGPSAKAKYGTNKPTWY